MSDLPAAVPAGSGGAPDWERRCLEAERIAEDLATALLEARAEVAALSARADTDSYDAVMDASLTPQPSLAADGSDPGVVPVALGATALVAGLVVLLALLNGRLFSVFGAVLVVATVALGSTAWQLRDLRGAQVRLRGTTVMVRDRDGEHLFDLSRETTRVRLEGEPGRRDWQAVFARRGLDDVVVTPRMTDPEAFTAALRRLRPEL